MISVDLHLLVLFSNLPVAEWCWLRLKDYMYIVFQTHKTTSLNQISA